MLKKLLLILCFLAFKIQAQEKPIRIVEEKKANKVSFYAFNESYTDYDVKLVITGSNIKQSQAKPRFVRVPATSKVLIKNIFLLRGKTPSYKYQLEINDSLSKRALKRPFTLIKVPPKKIKPRKPIVVYVTNNCASCDSIVGKLTAANYIFTSHKLKENPEIQKQLERILAKPESALDSVNTPILNIGGRIYTWIEKYEQVLEELDKE
ncbi:hypothetical protein GWK08_00100 [Leptobacterium flavescens]|uniref:Uncharacterized protein n=1 Tax=Leptobacterium flavescens TaxID=472055 RepID=A0A6P0UH86_9FLAO|nr:hypothetical protein [Leptobacterium flavescens]NER11830.1 hypothetical protein [Leptobacterium flavescens]